MNKCLVLSFLCMGIILSTHCQAKNQTDIDQLTTYFRQLKSGIQCFFSKKPCTPQETKVVRQTIMGLLGIITLTASTGIGVYLASHYTNAKWRQPINQVLPILGEKFYFDPYEEDMDSNRDYVDKETGLPWRKPGDIYQDRDMIMLAAEGNEEAFNKIRALNRPAAVRAALFIAQKRGHHRFAKEFKKRLLVEHLFTNWGPEKPLP